MHLLLVFKTLMGFEKNKNISFYKKPNENEKLKKNVYELVYVLVNVLLDAV